MTTQNLTGFIAKQLLNADLPLRILKSNAGFYIGTFLDEEIDELPGAIGPVTRESEEYYITEKEAQFAFDNALWSQRFSI